MDEKKKYIIIVESPTQAQAIQSILGNHYNVIATRGHILRTDLAASHPDDKNDFSVRYAFKNRDLMSDIINTAYEASIIFIATDPDQEGEAVAWHLAYLLREISNDIQRIILDEITPEKIKKNLGSPVPFNTALVDAQKARMVIDQLIGTGLSPLLNQIDPLARSAGRVQSAALIVIYKHELGLIDSPFSENSKVYIEIKLGKKEANFSLKELIFRGNKIINPDTQIDLLKKLLSEKFSIAKLSAELTENGYLNTYQLLQEGIQRFGRSGRQIMKTAQQLYEGIETQNGWLNLITYPRTESIKISNQSLREITDYFIRKGFNVDIREGDNGTTEGGPHAILPVQFSDEFSPNALKIQLTRNQFELYKLIWNWSLNVSLHGAGKLTQRIRLNSKNFQFTIERDLYDPVEINSNQIIEKDPVYVLDFFMDANENNPDHFDEAALLHVLYKQGIGRPSTLAEIVPILIKRKYIELVGKKIHITALGREVAQILDLNFDSVTGPAVTKKMETHLRRIAADKENYLPVVSKFKNELDNSILKFQEKAHHQDIDSDKLCSICSKPLIKRHTRNGIFFVCEEHREINRNFQNI